MTLNTRTLKKQLAALLRPRRLHLLLGLLLVLLQDVSSKQVHDIYSKQQVATSQHHEVPKSQAPRSQSQQHPQQMQTSRQLDDATRLERDAASEAPDSAETGTLDDESYPTEESESSSSTPEGLSGDGEEATEPTSSLPAATNHLRPSRQSTATTSSANVSPAASTTSKPRLQAGTSPIRLAGPTDPTIRSTMTVTSALPPMQMISSRRGQVAPEQTWAPTFNVNMGADRMIIKPPVGGESAYHEMRTEPSSNHELVSTGDRLGVASHERRQDLLYPSNVVADQSDSSSIPGRNEHPYLLSSGRIGVNEDTQDAGLGPMNVPSICYTPMALLTVILVTMSITVLVCFFTHLLMKYLGRHQFDLIRNSKLFEAKHENGFLHQQQGAAYGDRRQFASRSAPSNVERQAGCNNQLAAGNPGDGKHSCMLGLLHRDQQHLASGHNLQRLRDEHGCAFDNPYFKDDNRTYGNYPVPATTGALLMQPKAADNSLATLTTATSNPVPADQRAESQQLNFIEHHISNLHSRQVTSSVVELSTGCETILTASQPAHAAQVVDLTSDEQREKVLADPREGDLIAVDITGHDFIGLGFDVCGSQQEGIFIKSLLSRGPARESGCIQPGDQIKSVNISFDQVSVQDAFDILNSGSPYKMRLLLEKRVLPTKMLSKMQSPSATITPLPGHFEQSRNYHVAGSQQYLMASEQQVAPASGGPLKSYLRRLANFVTSGGSDPVQVRVQPLEPPVYLGSAAARRHRSSAGMSGVPMANMVAHTNAAYGATSDEEDTNNSYRRRPRAGRGSLDSSEALGSTATTTNELAADSSLDCYHTGNSNHRLHGPHSANWRQLDLRMVSQQDDARPPTKKNGHTRRQSMVTNVILSQHHLEQTQSQPEMAIDELGVKLEDSRNNMVGESLPRLIASSVSAPSVNLFATSSEQSGGRRMQQTGAHRSDSIQEENTNEVDRSRTQRELSATEVSGLDGNSQIRRSQRRRDSTD